MSKDLYGSRFDSLDWRLGIAQLEAVAMPLTPLPKTKTESSAIQSDMIKERVNLGSAEGILHWTILNEVRKRRANSKGGRK